MYIQGRPVGNRDSKILEPDRPQNDGTASVTPVLSPSNILPPH